MLSFDVYHSLIEVKRYLTRFLHTLAGTARLEGILHTEYNEFDALIKPLFTWLGELGVRFELGAEVVGLDLLLAADQTSVVGITYKREGTLEHHALTEADLVFVTNGSMTQNTTFGDNNTPVIFNHDMINRGVFTLWEKLAAIDEKFGHPEKFINWPEKSYWISFFTAITDYHQFVEYIEKKTSDKAGNGGAVTIKDSSWQISFMLHSKPFYPNQPNNMDFFGPMDYEEIT